MAAPRSPCLGSLSLVNLDHLLINTIKPLVDCRSMPLSQIPQVASNSQIAKCIRCAFAEALIAHELYKHIFQSFHSRDVELGNLTKAISGLEAVDRQFEAAIIRCQIARICTELGEEELVLGGMADRVYSVLERWLNGGPTQASKFKADLTAFFSRSIKIWRGLQRCDQRVRAEASLMRDWQRGGPTYGRRKEYDAVASAPGPKTEVPQGASVSASALGPDRPLAVLFPMIIVGNSVLFHGYALFDTQAAVAAAWREGSGLQQNDSFRQQRRASDSGRRDQRRQSRHRPSSVVEGGGVGSRPLLGSPSDTSYTGRILSQAPSVGTTTSGSKSGG